MNDDFDLRIMFEGNNNIYDNYINKTINRNKYVRRFSWAIPSMGALEIISKYSPILEIGSGTGYWAFLLKAYFNCDIKCYDKRSEFKKWFCKKTDKKTVENFCHVPPIFENNMEKIIKENKDRTLFLCWPVENADCVKYYKGKHIIYIGESEWGCTGSEKFFNIINKKYKSIIEYNMIQWPGLHDYLYVYERLQ